ncbi:MAG: DUF4124 domain-containing protein [Wenzhouxiangellaceae bacterium]
MAISEWVKGSLAVLSMAAAFALAPLATVHAQEIYKTVDENGNVVYTDQKPSDDAVPVKLKELTVVDPVELGDVEAAAVEPVDDETAETPEFGLEIVSPDVEETIWNTAYVLSVDVSATRELPSEAELAYLIDGEVHTTSQSTSVDLEEVFRGEHQLSVELRDADGRVLDSAGPVTFFMRQHSRQHPNPGRPIQPRGGTSPVRR